MRPPVLYLDFKRPLGNFHQGLVPRVNRCLLGQDSRGRVTQDRDFTRGLEELLKPQTNSLMIWARKYQYLG